jgi:hypothetical protein
MTIEHTDIQTGEQHVVANWALSSISQLTALTTQATDVGKQAWVAGSGHYVLAATDPDVWERVSPTLESANLEGTTLTLTLTDASRVDVELPNAQIAAKAATFATIPPLTTPCFVFVAEDETNDGLPTVYFYDGSSLQWLPSVEV